MPPSAELPPPPEHPELPPDIRIPGEEEIAFRTEDGVLIEARGYFPATAERAIALCHPHPLYGGTFNNAIVVSVAKGMLERAPATVAWLRLNFRGVGRSEGRYDAATREVLDVLAAFAEIRYRSPEAKVEVMGYSFGAGVAYRAAVRDGGLDRVCLVAPTLRMMRDQVGKYMGPLQIVAASNDEFASVEETAELGRKLEAPVHVIDGADHLFVRHRREVAGVVARFLVPEIAP
ncbi:MAG TPA: alpha/beta hydrolase [Polyangiaceae bacterium]|jgi:alpha/beta superfamily hydrolase|nr:alpha/beta hydrolase [Polyangiaceae bacterium]